MINMIDMIKFILPNAGFIPQPNLFNHKERKEHKRNFIIFFFCVP